MKTLFINEYLPEIATTRFKAKELYSIALKNKSEAISFKDMQFASRSFLHELLSLSEQKDIKLVDCNSSIAQLIKLIESDRSNPIAPILKIRRAEPVKI